MLAEAQRRADAFSERYAGHVAELDGPGLAEAMHELGDLQEIVGRAGSFSGLHFSTDTADPERGALFQRVQEKATPIETKLLFFELEWAAVDDERADELLATEGLDFCRHHLHTARRYRPYLLSEPEEKILAEKSLTARNAWGRLFEEQIAALQVDMEEGAEPVSLEVALSHLHSADRSERAHAAERVSAALEPGLRTRGFVFNTLLADKMVDDRLRGYSHWLQSRNLANEASDESVAGAGHRGPQPLRAAAPLVPPEGAAARARPPQGLRPHGRGDGREPDRALGRGARPRAGLLLELLPRARRPRPPLPTERWIDAPVRPGKRAGAFCAYTVPSVHPYVMLNWTSRRRDVLTLAHELGHGVHASLGGQQGIYHFATPLTLAETASVFGETIVFGRLLEQAATPESRLSLLAESIEGSIATVFRQIAMNQFEDRIHTERRERASSRSTASASCGRTRRRSCSATRSRSPRATAPGGPTCTTS